MSFKQCAKCIMDTTDPDINFDMEGVCNHCREWVAKEKQRKLDKLNLPWIIYELKKKGCLLGLSGGVDSSMCLHLLKEQGVYPVCFSLDNDTNTEQSTHNVKNLVEKTGVKWENIKIDMTEYDEIRKAFMMSGVPNIEIPTDHILMALSYQYASKHGIKYIVSGGNFATESIMPKAWGHNARDLTHIKDIYYKMTGKKIKKVPTISLLEYIYYRFIKGIKIIQLLNYYEYNRKNSIKILKEKYDYKDYGEKHAESTFTKWFQNCFLPERWGVDKRKAHLSSEILSNQLTRKEALEELAKPLTYPPLDKKFERYIGEPKSHADYKQGEKWWVLFGKIYQIMKKGSC